MSKVVDYIVKNAQFTRPSDSGNTVHDMGYTGIEERYKFDFDLCKPEDGWHQFDTNQDASYFGIWVNVEERAVVTFADGDLSVVVCEDDDHMRAELASMVKFYGSAPPAFIVIDEDGSRTDYYTDRPSV